MNASAPCIAIKPTGAALRENLRSTDRSLFITSSPIKTYQHPLIATDLTSAEAVTPVLHLCEGTARIVVLSAVRIPFSGLHMLSRRRRLESAIEQAMREDLAAFVGSTHIDGSRFDLIVHRGDLAACVPQEIESRDIDLFILAMTQDSISRRRVTQLIEQVLTQGRCDVVIIRNHIEVESGRGHPELLPVVPW